MSKTGRIVRNMLVLACACFACAARSAAQTGDAVSKAAVPNGAVGQATITVGKSLILDSSIAITRLVTTDTSLVEAKAVSPKEVLLNGKAPGETSVIIWREDGTRLNYDLSVRPSQQKINPEARSDKPGEGK